MTELQYFIKGKRKVYNDIDFSELPPCPMISPDDYIPTWMSFITKEEDIEEAYWLAKYVFDMAFKSQTYTSPSKNDPWTLTTAIKVYFKEDVVNEYLVQVRIIKLEGLGKYSFVFKRLQGDPLSYSKIWQWVEPLVLAKRSADGKHLVFEDDYNIKDVNGTKLETKEIRFPIVDISKNNIVDDEEDIEDKVRSYDGDEFRDETVFSADKSSVGEVGVSI